MKSRWECGHVIFAAILAAVLSAGSIAAGATPDRPAILAELRDFTVAGMSKRLGPDFSAYHKQDEKLPQVYLVPPKQEAGGRQYQIGGPWVKDAGDYSSTQGQVLYVPDPGAFPVDRVTIIEWAHGCFTEAPLAPWHGGFRPEPASEKWKKAAKNFEVGTPIGEARGMGGWANNGVIFFSSGLVSTGGTVTARGLEPTFQFPPNKLPTAISLTNKSEFALVTVVDTDKNRGQVAVFSMQVNGKVTHFVHEWQDDQAWSLPSTGLFTGMKLLGYVDLPGIEFPTGVCAVGNREGGRMNGRDGNAGLLREYDLAKQADRDVFLKGSNAHYGSSAGFAVVTARYENKAAFIDLQPLFERVRQMYFTSEENFQKTRNAGPAANQWPFAFEADASWTPVVVKGIDVPQPTAVIASMSGGAKARAFIASMDGNVGVYTVGGLAGDEAASPEQISRVAQVRVGPNPTCLAYQKYSSDTIIAVSRGDREIAWIKCAKDDPQVIRRLRDERLIDPVFVEVSDTHGIETSLLTAADFRGRKILNYRYSRLVFATQGGARFGMGASGKDQFECGGILELPGSPFCISATNVN